MNTSRREFLRTFGTGVAALGFASAQSRSVFAAERPNILWIYSDDHAYQAISAYGGRLEKVAPTPNIDRIAKRGMIFRNSYVTNSICGPCRAVVLTGKHSHINGFMKNGDQFDGNQQTFPKLLQKSGYQTAVFGKWHLGTDPTGFDAWDILPGQGHYYNPDFISPGGRRRESGYVSDIITDKAMNWLKKDRKDDKPFMLMLQHKAPHREWEPGPDHLSTFDGVTIPEPDTLFDDYSGRGTAAHEQDMTIDKTMRMRTDLKVWDDIDKSTPIDELTGTALRERRTWERTFGRMTAEQRKNWEAAYSPKNVAFRKKNLSGKDLVRWKYQRYMKDYLRCIRSVDDNVGRVLDYLKASGLDKNTVVFYSSDQSFYLGEHGWFDKRFIYEESARTPLLAQWPGVIAPGSETTAMVQNLDAAETFLDIAGASIPDDMQGRSIVPLMQGKTPSDWRNSLYYQYYEGEGQVHNVYKHYGVITPRYKLVYFYTLNEWEFYDLDTDPQELKSQYTNPEYEETIKEMHEELARLREHYKVTSDPEVAASATTV